MKGFDGLVTFQVIVGYSETGGEADEARTVEETAEEAENVGRKATPHEPISVVLANAGHVLEGADAEIVLNPLRLAFDTKNLKVIELSLDCLHVRYFYLSMKL